MKAIESWRKKEKNDEDDDEIIIELEDHRLFTFSEYDYVTDEEDLKPYTGEYPNKQNHWIVPGDILSRHGIEKIYSSEQETITITLSSLHKEVLEELAEWNGKTISECIANIIDTRILYIDPESLSLYKKSSKIDFKNFGFW